MKGFVMALLGVIFVTLMAGSVQSVTADHLKPGEGIFKDEKHLNYSSSKDSKYQIYLHVEVRDAQGQLVNVSEAIHGNYVPHQITDQIFDEMVSKREILIIDKITYEKVQYTNTVDTQHDLIPQDLLLTWSLKFDVNVDGHGLKRLPIFQADAPLTLTEGDILTFHWTVLRALN